MKCENHFCVYQENGVYILDEIDINSLGICDSCIYINIPKEDLKRYKEELRNNMINY